MNLLLISILTLNVVYLSVAQNNKECKVNKDADTCLMHLFLVGDPQYKFPETKAEMSSHCKKITGYERCIKDYSSKCLEALPKQVTSVLAYGVAKTNKGYCTNRRRKEQFIAMGKCGNTIKKDADICMRQFIDNLQGAENYPDVPTKIPMSCCNFYKLKTCILKASEKPGKKICTESNVDEIERIIDGYAFDVLQLICGDYTEDSDKCGKIVSKTPKKLPSQKRPKSILYPFINIIGSEPQ